jgi:phage terminase small subunit
VALSNKQKVFIEAYLKSWNATQAAIEAGYSQKSARVIGHENLTKPDISAEIQRRVDEVTLSANEVLARLAEHARADYKDFISVSANGDVAVDMAKADGKTHLIKKVTQRRTIRTTKDSQIDETVLSLELHDAQAALVQIGRHHKLFTDKVDVEHSGSIDFTADERAQAARELDEWQRRSPTEPKTAQKKAGAISNG